MSDFEESKEEKKDMINGDVRPTHKVDRLLGSFNSRTIHLPPKEIGENKNPSKYGNGRKSLVPWSMGGNQRPSRERHPAIR